MPWLESAVDYLQNNWVRLATSLAVAVLILGVAIVAGNMLGRWVRKSLSRRSPRSATLAGIVGTAAKIATLMIGVIMALDQIGVNVGAILAGAGILGLAIGFGSQSLVKDVVSGFFLIFDEALTEGDIANVSGEATGTVERVGLRMTLIRSFNGQLWYVQNGEITRVGNFSREWMRAIVEVGLAYEQDVAHGMRVLQKVGDEWADRHQDIVLEPPEAQGVMGLNASDVGLRLVVKVKAPNLWAAERELRTLVKQAFDDAGVEIPFPRHVVYHRQENDGALLIQTKNGASQPRPAAARSGQTQRER